MAKISQLRIYTINEGQMDEWVQYYREKALPIRLKLGFKAEGAWVMEDENKFVWIMSYDGPDAWQTANQAYMNSPERAALQPSPSEFINHIEAHFLTPVQYE